MDIEPKMLEPTTESKITLETMVASSERNGPRTGVADAVRELKSRVDFGGVEAPRAANIEEKGILSTHPYGFGLVRNS